MWRIYENKKKKKMKSKKCKICGKEIKGWNDSMIDYNMKVHIDTQHKEEAKYERTN